MSVRYKNLGFRELLTGNRERGKKSNTSGMPQATFPQTSPPVTAQSPELQEAERLQQQVFQLYQQ